MARDEWTKGETVYTSNVAPGGAGGVITVKRGDIAETANVRGAMTRAEVEAFFAKPPKK